MKIDRKLAAWMMTAAMLTGIGSTGTSLAQEAAPAREEVQGDIPADALTDTLTIAFSSFGGNFSPFFAQQKNDLTAAELTQEHLLAGDRSGGLVLEGIEGESISYGDEIYTYYGPADCAVTESDDGSVDYEIRLRDDLTFSDGEPVTIDDVIFSLYVRCDPTYDGPSELKDKPIAGLSEYRSGMASMLYLMTLAGENNTNFTY